MIFNHAADVVKHLVAYRKKQFYSFAIVNVSVAEHKAAMDAYVAKGARLTSARRFPINVDRDLITFGRPTVASASSSPTRTTP